MNHRERFLATIERTPVDRPCTWMGIPDSQALPGLYNHFGVDSVAGLTEVLDDDIVPIEFPYHSPTADASTWRLILPSEARSIGNIVRSTHRASSRTRRIQPASMSSPA